MIEVPIDGQLVVVSDTLITKYSQPGPRYTSYPTAPNWHKDFGPEQFYEALRNSNRLDAGTETNARTGTLRPLSLYFHLPFCEERCTFCACSIVATRQRERVQPYLKALLREIDVVAEVLDSARKVVQIHWGGGTPTYFSSAEMARLFNHIAKRFQIAGRNDGHARGAEISIEIDPRVTSDEQLMTLRELGFNRVSLGVQDFDLAVQQQAGRIQSETETRHTIDVCRLLNFDSINVDLVYGLPRQTPAGFETTLQKVLALDPDRVALFNFAYVPWLHPHQKKIAEADLPPPHTKLEMFCRAIEQFENAGYEFIGLDHFAKKSDELVTAKNSGTMYRNFQGYTTHRECDLIGLGVTAISAVNGTFAQNAKKLKDYQEGVFKTGLTTHCGLRLSEDDRSRQTVIRELFCHQKAVLDETFSNEIAMLKELEMDGLVKISVRHLLGVPPGHLLEVTPLGRLFLRNIGMVFDAYLNASHKTGEGKFSKTV